jgi:uncharacterized OB-fold protein
MPKEKEAQEFLTNEFTAILECRYDTGPYMGRFLTEFRDHKKIWGCKCPSCGYIYSPPHGHCYFCHGVELEEWVELGDEGVLEHFSVVNFPFVNPMTGEEEPIPWAHGIFEMKHGAFFSHRMTPPDPTKHKVGDRYKAVWREGGRTGHFWDILYFEKVGEGGRNG